MKVLLRLVVFAMLFNFMFSTRVLAASSKSEKTNIVIDGDFNDWKGKPYIVDNKKDIAYPSLDFLGLGYFADDKYLYLHVTRQASRKYEPWHFSVVILNATKGQVYPQYYFGAAKLVYSPQFDVITYYNGSSSHNGIIVDVLFNGKRLESTFSSDNNAKEIEFRIPLAYVGINGVNKEVKFILKSDVYGTIDWLPDRPITITTGPTLWKASYVFFFVVAASAAYRAYRRKIKEFGQK